MWRFELKKKEKKMQFNKKEVQRWRPKEGKYVLVIDLGSTPQIQKREYDGRRKMFACFNITVLTDKQEIRKKWCIPVAGVRKENDKTIIEIWENSQRGSALMEIAENFGYQPHIIEVYVQRNKENKLDTKYEIKHSDECPCLEKQSNSKEDQTKIKEKIDRLKKIIRDHSLNGINTDLEDYEND